MFECVSPPDAVMWPAARSITCSDSPTLLQTNMLSWAGRWTLVLEKVPSEAS